MIDFEHVNKFVLSDISLHIPAGETVGLIGGPGSGKTTLLKLACGLLKPEAGSVLVDGRDPVQRRQKRGVRAAAFFAGMPFLGRDDTVLQGFELLRHIYRIPETQFKKDYEELSARLDFRGVMHETVKTLSLGQRMRAELGAVFMLRPEVLLLDEPNMGLDENGKAVLCDILTERNADGLTVFVSSNDVIGIAKLCSRFVLLSDGRIQFYGSGKNLRRHLTPVDVMTVVFDGNLPDMEDLPLNKYEVSGNQFRLSYNSNFVTAAEILNRILGQTKVCEVNICKPNLEQVLQALS